MKKVLVLLLAIIVLVPGCGSNKLLLSTKKLVDKAYDSVDNLNSNAQTLAANYLVLLKISLKQSTLTEAEKKKVLKKAEELVKAVRDDLKKALKVIKTIKKLIDLVAGEKDGK